MLVSVNWPEVTTVTVIGFCLVLLVLLLLVYVMKLFGYVFMKKKENTPVTRQRVPDEELAAIATAIQIYKSNLHDSESEVITINRIARVYSPWNSKIHGLTQMPQHRNNR